MHCILHHRLMNLAAAILLAPLVVGCASSHDCLVRQALREKTPPVQPGVAAYRIGAPDTLRITVEGKPELSKDYVVQANGCIDFGEIGGVRVEGLTAPEIGKHVATLARLGPEAVKVNVADYQSQQVYLAGEVTGLQRAVAYQGPETIVDLLRRTGGITEDGAPDEVRIVRNPMLAKSEPEVLHVDLRAILMKRDGSTNVVVQPYDQIFVPETKSAKVGKCLHPWLRSVGKAMAAAPVVP